MPCVAKKKDDVISSITDAAEVEERGRAHMHTHTHLFFDIMIRSGHSYQ